MFNGTFFSTHSRELVEEHVEKTFFRRRIFVAVIIPVNKPPVNNQTMLIKDRLQSVNNAILFSDISTYLFYVDVLFSLDKVFFE